MRRLFYSQSNIGGYPFEMMRGWAICAITVLIVIGCAVAVISPIMVGVYFGEKGDCGGWGKATGRDAKFEVTLKWVGVPLSWDCYTTGPDGKKVTRSNVFNIQDTSAGDQYGQK